MKNTNKYSYCNVVGDTNVGCKRKANEDWYAHFECENGLVSVVCDGMGGHVGGAVASHLAVETIQAFLENNYFEDPRRAIVEACNAANSAILQRTSQQPELTGMGSTCVMLIVRDGKVYMGSVGDSRIYLIRSKTITQLTKDQSYVQMLVDEGAITKEQAEHHPRKNEITNALGLPSMQPATVLPDSLNPEAGDCFLMCSDGLSGMVSDHEILKVASNQAGMTQRERVTELIQRARKNGGLDNITCLIVEFAITPEVSSDGGFKKKVLLRYVLPCVVAVLLLGIGGCFLWKHIHRDPVRVNLIAPCSDTILFEKNKRIIEIHSSDSVYVMYYNKSGVPQKVYVNCGKIEKENITIQPVANFSSSESDGYICYTFNNKSFKDDTLVIELKTKDTVYSCTISVEVCKDKPVEQPSSLTTIGVKEERGAKDVEERDVKEEKQTEKESGKVLKEVYNSVGDAGVVNLDSNKGETKILLVSCPNGKECKSNRDTLYTKYGIKSHSQVDGPWYTHSCSNGQVCNITIKNDKVPGNNAVISIELNQPDKQYRISVNKYSR